MKQKEDNEGQDPAQQFVNQFGGTNPSNQAVNMLFSTPQIQQIVQEASQRTGLDAGMIESMLPMLVPIVLKFLQQGNSTQGGNPLLNTFLDANHDGNVDVSDMMQMAFRQFGK